MCRTVSEGKSGRCMARNYHIDAVYTAPMFANLTPAARVLLFTNVGIWLLQQFLGDGVFAPFMLWSPEYGAEPFRPWQIVTYAFLHSREQVTHIFFNMFALYMFGPEGERRLGTARFLVYYFSCVVGAALAQLLVIAYFEPSPYPTVGASGAIFGLLLLYGVSFPHRRLMLVFPPIPMPAWLFVTLYGVLELILGLTNSQAGVAHFAHLGGMALGLVLILVWRIRPLRE